MTIIERWTTDAVAVMPRVEGERYEIIDGELYVTTQPNFQHQAVCDNLIIELGVWSRATGSGRTIQAPGIVYDNDQAVAPDLVWVSRERLNVILGADGKLHASPEIVIEILSPGKANEERDRDKKLGLYGRQHVSEYWILDWQAQTIDIYRQEQNALIPVQTLTTRDNLTSPQLPGFVCSVRQLFEL